MDTALISVLERLGAGAGIIVILIICRLLVPYWVHADLKAENRDLKAALKAERERGDAAVAAMQANRDAMQALRTGIQIGLEQRAVTAKPEVPP